MSKTSNPVLDRKQTLVKEDTGMHILPFSESLSAASL